MRTRRGANANAAASRGGVNANAAPRKLPDRERLHCEGPVMDVQFAPSALGLKIASCTADGKVRIFECENALELKSWESEDLEPLPRHASSVEVGNAALDWMPVLFGGGFDQREALAVGGGSGRLAIWNKTKKLGQWSEVASVKAHPSEHGGVKDVAWCPNLCRPYEIIATCGGGAALWRLEFDVGDGIQARGAGGRDARGGQLQLLKELYKGVDESCRTWRCTWNLTGTNLALCPEGGEVSVWKADAGLEWRCAAESERMDKA